MRSTAPRNNGSKSDIPAFLWILFGHSASNLGGSRQSGLPEGPGERVGRSITDLARDRGDRERRQAEEHRGDLHAPAVSRVAPVASVDPVAGVEIFDDSLKLARRQLHGVTEVRRGRPAREVREL